MANSTAPIIGATTIDGSTTVIVPTKPTTIIAQPADKHCYTVVFLPGREDFGSDLAKYFFDSKSFDGSTLAEIFPSYQLVRRGSERRISQWFYVWDIDVPEDKKELMIPGLQESIGDIVEIIERESQEVPFERIILGGISQGCATAILTLLSSGMDLGGFIGWCSWLPFQKAIANLPTNCINNKEILSQHIQNILHMSTDSDSPSIEQAKLASQEVRLKLDDETMERLGFDVSWKDYADGGHWIHPKLGVDDMATFLHNIMGT